MPAIESLPSDQRAVLELILRRGRSYRELATLLSVDLTAVRRRATDATEALTPSQLALPSAHEAITDYLLGQLPEALSTQAMGLLETSAPANAWALAISAELSAFAPGAVAKVPFLQRAEPDEAAPPDVVSTEPEPAPAAQAEQPSAQSVQQVGNSAIEQPAKTPIEQRSKPKPSTERPATDRPAKPAAPQPTKSSPARPAKPRPATGAAATKTKPKSRLPLLLGAIAALLIVAVILISVLSGGGKSNKQTAIATGTVSQGTTGSASSPTSGTGTTETGAATATTGTDQTTSTAAQTKTAPLRTTVTLTSPAGYRSTIGVLQVISQGSARHFVLRAEGLPATSSDNAYAVWLYSPTGANRLLGFVTNEITANGQLDLTGTLPADAGHFQRLLLTLETDPHPTTPGTVVLTGALTAQR